MNDDLELLRDYVAHHSEAAFARLVERHINMVYSVALRHVGNPHHAQEITQAVFVILARKATGLHPDTIVSGWLFKAARLNAVNFIRTETRRIRREQENYMQSLPTESEPAAWEQIAPHLDKAIAGLGETDRNAVVLRFLEGKDFREVGVALGASEDAAKMRVHRALEKLRKFFTRKGVVLTTAGLTGLITVNAVQAAPVGLAAATTAAAVKGAALSVATLALVKGATNLMAWTTKLKIAAGVGVAALVAYQTYKVIDQQQQLDDVRNQFEQQSQSAKDQTTAQQAALEDLKQQKLALMAEKQRDELATSKLLSKQRAETDAAVTRANTATARADMLAKGTAFNALAAFLMDPANREMMRLRYHAEMRARYAGLARELKLSPEDTGRFVDLMTDNEMKSQERLAALWQKSIDIDTAIAERDSTTQALRDQVRSWLGDNAEQQYERIQKDINADDGVNAINRELGDHPLSDDQAKRLRELIRAQPEIPVSSEDFFRTPEAMEALAQRLSDRSQNLLKAAAEFLTPEQMTAAKTLTANDIDMLRKQMGLAKQFFSNRAGQTAP